MTVSIEIRGYSSFTEPSTFTPPAIAAMSCR